ncbi:MAG: accessory Sec system protein Asp3 [Ruminococcus flavefaciens]|nr:accessory Sec system protein Asp3 [Ruminococcus flavefaciens]
MTGEKWIIYWNEYSSNTYLYGSEVTYHAKDDVEYANLLMPPGTVIKQWYSKTYYQMQRIEPALPIIDGESRYRVTVHIDCPENESWLMQLVFCDKYDAVAGRIPLRDKVSYFQCPLRTYSYRLELVNGGMTRFHFHYVEIQEVEDEQEEESEKTI